MKVLQRYRYTPAGHLLRQARQIAGLTQSDMAAAAGIAPGRLSEYENGKREPTVDMLLRLLAATGHTVALVDGNNGAFANPYINARTLTSVLSLTDAMSDSLRPAWDRRDHARIENA